MDTNNPNANNALSLLHRLCGKNLPDGGILNVLNENIRLNDEHVSDEILNMLTVAVAAMTTARDLLAG